jgi:hypothetical protein
LTLLGESSLPKPKSAVCCIAKIPAQQAMTDRVANATRKIFTEDL